MGKMLSKLFGNKEMRVLMLGLDASGKTSILFMSGVFGSRGWLEEGEVGAGKWDQRRSWCEQIKVDNYGEEQDKMGAEWCEMRADMASREEQDGS